MADSNGSLTKLFTGLYGQPPMGQAEVADERLAKALCGANPLQDPVIFARAALASAALSPRQAGMVKASSAIVTDFFHQPLFHPELAERLLPHTGALIGQALLPGSWLTRKSHPLVQCLGELAQFAQGWYPAHPQADDIAGMLQSTLDQLYGDGVDDALAVFRQWRSNFVERTEKVAARVVQSESGTLRARYARGLAARTINRQIAGRPLPTVVARALESIWLPAFQWVLLDQGDRSPLWSSLVKVFSLLVWSLQENSVEQKSKLHRVIDQLKQELPPLLETLIKDDSQRAQVLEEIEIIHLCLLHERAVDYEGAPMLEGSTALDQLDAEVSADLLQEVTAIRNDQWFVQSASGMRMHLQQRVDEYQQLLFLNQQGMKALACGFEEFALFYSSGEIQPVAELQPLSEWAQSHLQRLADQYRVRQKARQDEQQKLAAMAAAQEAEQKAEKVAELRQRAEAKERARHAAERLQQEKLASLGSTPQSVATEQEVEQQRRESATAELGSTPEQRRQRARLLVSSISVGTWMNFFGDDGSEIRRKLAVILPSSNKYIFVDRVGADKLQLTRDELISAVAEGAASPLQRDARFDDALSRIVGDMTRGR